MNSFSIIGIILTTPRNDFESVINLSNNLLGAPVTNGTDATDTAAPTTTTGMKLSN